MDLWTEAPDILNKLLRANTDYLNSLLELEKAYKAAEDDDFKNNYFSHPCTFKSFERIMECDKKCKDLFLKLSELHSKVLGDNN